MRKRALVLTLPLFMITGCTNSVQVGPTDRASMITSASSWTLHQGSASPEPTRSWTPDTTASGTFLPHRPGSTAITYDPAVVPAGARATVGVAQKPRSTEVRLEVAGLIPRRTYGAHLHTEPCTAVPDQAGPHYQHQKDPKTPSVDPSYANPANEVWLDFTVDGYGTATAAATQPWTFPAGRSARSLILHAQATKTAAGVAGTAGPRVACLTLPRR
ncbi:superoxide dismutase family protein [Actinoplanes sp. TRM 88003]|uniref:Superoxide dismutase family protein n=1 Tax=Paractinoplanes aksuensis TaxID=2939490 RepID=A0ABT1E025_9ACTN|nr:superoxide dismutase family protein [Actinoplanes aksuensis]MCO8276375.1 superoxide dismutase family protein [Actinoplanes aksuensis]